MSNDVEKDFLLNRLSRMDDKLDSLVDDIGQIKITLAVNTKEIAEHIRRTNLLENKMDKDSLERDIQNVQNNGRFDRLELPGKLLNAVLKITASLSLLAGLVIAIKNLL